MAKQPLEATKSDLFNHFIDGSDSFRFFFIPVPLRSLFQILKVPSVLSALNFKSFDWDFVNPWCNNRLDFLKHSQPIKLSKLILGL